MTAKGVSKTCCCNGCEKPPMIWAVDAGDVWLKQVWQRYCCSCVPYYACVTVLLASDPTKYARALYKLYCPPSPEGLSQPLYKNINATNTMYVDGVSIDVTFRFAISGTECQLCLSSYNLGVTESDYGSCITINDAARGTPNFFCSRLSNTDDVLPLTTDRNLGQGPTSDGIGTEFTMGAYIVRLSRADHVAITERPNCLDAYGNQVIDTSPLKNKCCNCTCICRCMCLTRRSIAGSYATSACIGEDNRWTFPSGDVVELFSTAYDRTCYLVLSPAEGTTTGDVLLGGTNNCPRPTGSWGVSLGASGYYPAHTAQYSIGCVDCGGGCDVDVGDCCGIGRTQFPRVLYADVTTTCPDCTAFTVAMLWSPIDNLWIGETFACGRACKLSVSCGFSEVIIQWQPCTAGSAAAVGSVSCSPISGSYSTTSGGLGCCGGSSFITPTIDITVYE